MLFPWILTLFFSSVCGINLPDITDRSFVDICLQEHNKARSEVRPPATDMTFMTWDADLAVIARSWARRCVFRHNPKRSEHPTFSSLGENLWVISSASAFSAAHAIQDWVNEVGDYSYNGNSCREKKMCGHYTQVVWARSYKVGCAVHVCSSGIEGFTTRPGTNFVCNYGPAGNVIGRRPYQTNGEACSKCDPEDSCVDRLCRNKERDAEKSSSLSPLETEPSASDFVPVLIIRPVAVLGSVVAAVAVKHFYPDVFFYE